MARKRTNRKLQIMEHFAPLIRRTMEMPAWRALSPAAQALYPWLKLEWHGRDNNNNGQIRLSVRQAAVRIGIGRDRAAKAFHELQAKGFIVQTEGACLGTTGKACAPAYELTELAMSHSCQTCGRMLFKDWKPGRDFPVDKTTPHNPDGRNGKTKTCHQTHDRTIIKMRTELKKPSSR